MNDAVVHFISAEPLLAKLDLEKWLEAKSLDWVIAGGESGHKARPTRPLWVRSLRDQCNAHNVPFHFKQWGHWTPTIPNNIKKTRSINFKSENGHLETLFAVGKKLAGRQLDGKNWDGIPNGTY